MSKRQNQRQKDVDIDVRRGVVYISEAKQKFSFSQLKELTDLATVQNAKLGITGFLYYDHGRFLQYLEGPEQQLMDLLRKIRIDDRHNIIYTRVSIPLPFARFSDWSMQYLDPAALVRVNLKSVLIDYLSFAQTNIQILFQAESDEQVWNLIDKIAQAQAVLN
ncbi:MAG: BLUF domain-containing protein [Bacteroidota bacterium]